jgi:hypothetical protein
MEMPEAEVQSLNQNERFEAKNGHAFSRSIEYQPDIPMGRMIGAG